MVVYYHILLLNDLESFPGKMQVMAFLEKPCFDVSCINILTYIDDKHHFRATFDKTITPIKGEMNTQYKHISSSYMKCILTLYNTLLNNIQ